MQIHSLPSQWHCRQLGKGGNVRIDAMWEKMSRMCLAYIFVSLERMLTPIGCVSDRFHFVLAVPSKIISPQEFTQTFVLMTFCAQRAKFGLVVHFR